jgi:hypothetical protein
MALYYARWANGDLSFVAAESKEHARTRLDEVHDLVDLRELDQVRADAEFLLTLRPQETGGFQLFQFGEALQQIVMERYYPKIEAVVDAAEDLTRPTDEELRDAVAAEIARLE